MIKVITFSVILLLLFVSGELYARYIVGLGDPPLTIIDDKVEYLFAPKQTRHRFGNTIKYNSKSMRSAEPPSAEIKNITRVLVLGDSVVNGGVLTDQNNLATEIVSTDLGSKYWIGNISAGSWGPANIHAYIKKFGWFNADVAIFVFSTHDLLDLPEFRSSYGDDFPTSSPISALWEGVTRYLPRYVPSIKAVLGNTIGEPTVRYSDTERITFGAEQLRSLLTDAKSNVQKVIVLVHPTEQELNQPNSTGRDDLIETIIQSGAVVYDVNNLGLLSRSDYRDDIHLNDKGQKLYSLIIECLLPHGDRLECPGSLSK